MATLSDIQRIRDNVENLKRETAKAEGALGHSLQQLSDDFGCKSTKEAETLLQKLQVKESKAEKAFSDSFKAFSEKWAEVLGEIS